MPINYEIFLLFHPQVSESELDDTINSLEQSLVAEQITISKRGIALNRKLAYPIKHQMVGHTASLLVLNNGSANIAKIINRHFLGNDKLFRKIVVKKPDTHSAVEQTDSVIEQLQSEPSSSLTTQRTKEQLAPDHKKENEQETANIEEIDKKIEELLQ